jgi:tetratricopeptide (TPR) repeat protein
MSATTHDPSLLNGTDPELDRLIEELTRRVQAGEAVDLESFAREHPGHTEPLRRLLPALEMLAGLSHSVTADRLRAGASGPDPAAGLGELGDFWLVREVGRGGMGVVYEAEQSSLRRRVALKVLPFAAALDARQIQRFRVEAQAAACLHHPHIVPVYGVGCERGVHYYAMQLIDGQSLAAMIAELRRLDSLDPAETAAPAPGPGSVSTSELAGWLLTGGAADRPAAPGSDAPTVALPSGAAHPEPPSPRASRTTHGRPAPSGSSTRNRDYALAAARLALQAAEALDHAHTQGVLHRDIKPANLLLDAAGRLWVTDFGLAQVRGDDRLTCTGDVLGTLRYMSPEQALGRRVVIDGRTDVYSLGVTLYELLTLRPAFDGKDRAEILRQIASDEPAPLRKLNSAVPLDLETIVQKAMAKEPSGRYATAKELADDLRNYLEARPIRARRPSLLDRAAKWGRRHTASVAAASVILVLTVIGLAASTFLIAGEQRRTAAALTLASQREREAQTAAADSTRAAAESKAILTFLVQDMLGAVAPNEAMGRDVKVAEVLANAEKKIDTAFPNQPLVEAGVRHALGSTRYAQGQNDLALRQLSRSYELRRNLLGREHPETLASMTDLARALRLQGKPDDAGKLHEQALEIRRRILGPEHRDTLMSMHHIANCLWTQKRHDEACKLFEQALEIQRRVLGPEHTDTLQSMSNVASLLSLQGKMDEAGKLHDQTLEIQRRVLGPEHPSTLYTMNNLAEMLMMRGKFHEAHKLFSKTLEIRRRILGPEHPDTLESMHKLADTFLPQGKVEDARKLREEILEIQRRSMGPEHPDTLSTLAQLGVDHLYAGRPDEGARVMEDALRQAEGRTDALAKLKWVPNALAQAYDDSGQFEKAEPLLRVEVKRARVALGAEYPQTAAALASLGKNLLQQKKFAEAEPLLRECLAIREKLLADHWLLFNVRSMLGEALLGQSKPAEAEPLLVQGYEGMKAREASIPAQVRSQRLSEAGRRVIRLYNDLNQPGRAAGLLRTEDLDAMMPNGIAAFAALATSNDEAASP